MAAPAASQPALSAEMLLEQLQRLQLKNQSLESERQLLKSAISTCQPALDAIKFQATMDSGTEADKRAMQ
jgi:prefoldin subunit 5